MAAAKLSCEPKLTIRVYRAKTGQWEDRETVKAAMTDAFRQGMVGLKNIFGKDS